MQFIHRLQSVESSSADYNAAKALKHFEMCQWTEGFDLFSVLCSDLWSEERWKEQSFY